MFEEDSVKPKQPPKPNLEIMSIQALHDYIGDLQAEIERARAMIRQKQGVRGEAESLFKR
jgi:uncharacterized small protein (DUF1192 family)